MTTTRPPEWLILVSILVLAACLRLTRLDLVEFKYDEATTACNALTLHQEEHLSLGLASSQGFHHPPLTNYVLALPLALSRDPRLAAGWLALLGVGAVGLTYWVGRSYFGRRVGALAALLFAISPWAIFYSRKIWAQNLPLVTLLFVAALLAWLVRRRAWALSAALAAAGVLMGLHLGGLAFGVILAVLALPFWRRLRPLPLLLGLVLALLILSPYLLHDARGGWANLRAFKAAGRTGPDFDPQALHLATLGIGGYHLEDLAGERHIDFVASILDLRWLDRVEIWLFWLGLAWLVWRVGRQAWGRREQIGDDQTARWVLFCWFTVPVILLLGQTGLLHPHEFILLYPVQHLIIALFLVDVVDRGQSRAVKRTLGGMTVLLVGALVAWQIYFGQALLSFVDTHDTPGGHGAPLKYALAAARQAERLQNQSPDAELILLLPGSDPRHDGKAAVFDVLLSPERRLVDGRQALVLPAWPALILADPQAEPAASQLSALAEQVAPALPVRAGRSDSYRFFYWRPAAVTPSHPWQGEPVRWASGATLLGYDWSGEPGPGGTLHWTLYWHVDTIPSVVGDIHWFNQLLDRAGRQWGQLDGAGLPTAEWRAGDTVLTWFDIPISPEAPNPPYFVRCGSYTYPDVVNVQLLDSAGNPAGEFVELGPVDEP